MAKRRSLLVGVNTHAIASFALRGCVNDIDSLHTVLKEFYGFKDEDTAILTDMAATRAAILSGLKQLFSGIAEGDVIVFGFAGHGTKHIDPQNPKVLEAIVPSDTQGTADLISNFEINSIARQHISDLGLSGKVNFTAIYDCCHSGLMYRDLIARDGRLETGVINRVVDLSQLFPMADMRIRDLAFNDDFQVLSACRDNQTAADLSSRPEKGIHVPRGAFSFVLHNLIQANPEISIGDLEARITAPVAELVAPHQQVPVMAVREAWKGKPLFSI